MQPMTIDLMITHVAGLNDPWDGPGPDTPRGPPDPVQPDPAPPDPRDPPPFPRYEDVPPTRPIDRGSATRSKALA